MVHSSLLIHIELLFNLVNPIDEDSLPLLPYVFVFERIFLMDCSSILELLYGPILVRLLSHIILEVGGSRWHI